MTISRRILASSLAVLLLASAPGAAIAGSHEAATAEEAVALVLASDPRFAEASDWEPLVRRSMTAFEPLVFEHSYYRLLSPASSSGKTLEDAFRISPRAPRSWLYEVTLVRDCGDYVRPSGDAPAAEDPCAWRHSWFYRVQPDGSVTLLFEEGGPDT